MTKRRPCRAAGSPGRNRLETKNVERDLIRAANIDPAYVDRLRRSMRGALDFARRRQAKKASPVVVDVTVNELMEILQHQGYRCAISGRR
jgi:hypothetical protein